VDNVFNTVRVVISVLIVGIASGLLWDRLATSQRRLPQYLGGLAIGFVVVVAAVLVGNVSVDRLASVTIPLAAIVLTCRACWCQAYPGFLCLLSNGRPRLC
jgi:Na+/H+ antiporter NhaC